MVEVCGGFGEGVARRYRFVTLAFWITYARLEKETREEIETAIADLEFVQEYYEEEDEEKFDAIIEAIDCLEAL